jgi:hypothetical protein
VLKRLSLLALRITLRTHNEWSSQTNGLGYSTVPIDVFLDLLKFFSLALAKLHQPLALDFR